MVTSFRPRDPLVRDDTVLTTVRPISSLSELYYQFSEYRLEMLQERIRIQLETMQATMQAGKKFDTIAIKRFLNEQEDFLAQMDQEIVEDDHVVRGSIDDSHLFMDHASKKEEPKQERKRKRVPSRQPRFRSMQSKLQKIAF